MKPLAFAVLLFGATQIASAQMLSDTNLFNTGTSQATVAANTSYPNFSSATVVDGFTNGFVFGDYLRPGSSNTNINDQLMSISGFSDPTGIGSLVFFDIDNYEEGRVATQVTIYYSTSDATLNSLNPADYTALNGGLAYALPADLNSNNGYTSGTDPNNGYAYDVLSGLSIPAGTKSILLDFGPERDAYNGDTYFVGAGFAEIQAFGNAVVQVPEPTTWALMLGGVLALGIGVRRKGATRPA